MQILTPTSESSVILFNMFAASVLLGAAGQFCVPRFRRKSLPFQHRMLCLSLILMVISPISTGLATALGLGLVTFPITANHTVTAITAADSPAGTPHVVNKDVAPFSTVPFSTVEQSEVSPIMMGPSRDVSLREGTKWMNFDPVSLTSWLPTDVTTWIVLIWSTGFVYMLSRLAVGLLVVGRVRRSLRKATHPRLIQAAKRTLTGFEEQTAVYQSLLAVTPLTIGWWRCVIVVPDGIVDSLDDQQLASVIAHEAAHVRRRDTTISFLQQLAAAACWWNPFVRATNQRIDLLREQICDDTVVNRFGEGRSLASAIVKVIEWSSPRSVPVPLTVQLLSDYEVIETRIRRLLSHETSHAARHNVLTAAWVSVLSLFMIVVPLIPIAKTEYCWAAPDDAVVQRKAVWEMKIHVVDEEGNPIPNPRIGTRFLAQLEVPEWHDGNQQGTCSIRPPDRVPAFCYVYARADGYSPMRALWRNGNDLPQDALPDEFSFTMSKSVPVGGVVIDEQGKPIKGATVRFTATDRDSDSAERTESTIFQEKYFTDPDGRWLCAAAPQNIKGASIQVSHPGFPLDSTVYSLNEQIDELLQRSLKWTLKNGLSISGRVVDAEGNPTEGVYLTVCKLNTRSGLPIQKTDADGRYRFPVLPQPDATIVNDPIALTVTAMKPGFAPVMERVPGFGKRPLGDSTPVDRKLDFTLKPGVTISFRVLDSQKTPVASAWVNPMTWHETPALESLREFGIPDRTNENGIWEWKDAPPGETIQFAIESRGFARINRHPITAKRGMAQETVVMKRPQVIVGQVIDAQTKKAIPDFVFKRAFENVGGYPDGLFWTGDEVRGKEGEYQATITMPPHNGSYTYNIVAVGYEPAVSKSTKFTEGETRIDFELKKSREK